MKKLLIVIALIATPAPLAAQTTPTKVTYRARVMAPIEVGLSNYNLQSAAEGFRFKLTNDKGVTVQWGTDVPRDRLVADASGVFGGFNVTQSWPTSGTFDVQICAFGQVLNEQTVTWSTKEVCSDKGMVELVLNRNSVDKPTTITLSMPPGTSSTITASPTGTTTTTTPK